MSIEEKPPSHDSCRLRVAEGFILIRGALLSSMNESQYVIPYISTRKVHPQKPLEIVVFSRTYIDIRSPEDEQKEVWDQQTFLCKPEGLTSSVSFSQLALFPNTYLNCKTVRRENLYLLSTSEGLGIHRDYVDFAHPLQPALLFKAFYEWFSSPHLIRILDEKKREPEIKGSFAIPTKEIPRISELVLNHYKKTYKDTCFDVQD